MTKIIVRNHGEPLDCPSCGEPGHYDDMKSGPGANAAEFEDAVWFNQHSDHWECHYCWLK